jgi:putative SOS response-associated peptidase YedK
MCGRYRLGAGRKAFLKYFNANRDDLAWTARYNIAPTQSVPTIRQNAHEPKRELALMRWGLIPYWSKDASIGSKLINARCETVSTKPAFKEPLRRRRCLVPADGFYEWQRLNSKSKQPYCFMLADDSVFAFAGVWDRWRDAKGVTVETCAILTTTPNALTVDVHDRMPVILRPEDHDMWLDPGMVRTEEIVSLLKPYAADAMKRFPVSSRVNSVDNDDESCATLGELAREAPVSMALFDLRLK